MSARHARLDCLPVAILAALAVFAWSAARVHYVFGGNWTALFCTGRLGELPPDLRADTYRFGDGGYDGQFYRYIAHDPFLRNGYIDYVDAKQLRSRRILVPLAAWLAAFGQLRWIDFTYIAEEILFVALGSYWCARLLERRGRSPWWGLLFVLTPATLASFDRMLVDGPVTALFAGFLLYCEEKRWTRVWLLVMLAALARETGVLLAAALVIDRLRWHDWRRAAWYASSVVPAAAWYSFIAMRLPFEGEPALYTAPAWGLLRRLAWLRPYPDPSVQLLLRVTDVLAVLGLAISIVLAVRWLLDRPIGPVSICVAMFAAMALVLGAPTYMEEAYGFARPVSPLLLWVLLEAVTRKSWTAVAAPLLVSLSVGLAFGHPLGVIAHGLAGR